MKVLHVLYQSLPNTAGSSTRSHSLIKSQNSISIDAFAITSPIQKPTKDSCRLTSELIDGIIYNRSYFYNGLCVGKGGYFHKFLKLVLWPLFTLRLLFICFKSRPNILHAHSMFYCCFSSLIVGKLLSIPVVYEIRSRWELNPHAKSSYFKRLVAGYCEMISCKNASSVVVISKGLASYVEDISGRAPLIVRNGILKEHVFSERDIEIKYENIYRKIRFGYVGSVINLEGLDFVLEALHQLKQDGYLVDFYIYGDGSELEKLKQMSNEYKLNVNFMGKVPYESIKDAYSNLDVVINFRRDSLISHTVTPLKPLEAMANGCVVICSNVAGMIEITEGERNVYVVPADDIKHLSDCIKSLCFVSDIDMSKIKSSLAFIMNERTWESNAKAYGELYKSLIEKNS
ncbi:glycosyltransferase [Shewanella indica]|uniref:glycosyltransferase n=1 Tax=Shewanella indica TaxID=768528 RepID=UPI001F1BA2BF|nr:glycosyltransferase [Shewanella indica]MCE9793825.1 glycosyltransferase [Shewanella indica]